MRDDGGDVEDQGDAAVAQDGRRGDARHLPVVGLEALDHHLALALDGVDQQRRAAAALALDQQGHASTARRALGAEAERHADIDQRHVAAADATSPARRRRARARASASAAGSR